MRELILILSLGICFTQTADVDNNKSSSNISDKKNSIGIGLLTNKSGNLLHYTHDYKLSDNYAIFGVVGFVNVGLGIAWQSNYNANGMMICGTVAHAGDEVTFADLSLSYQWRLGKSSNFFSLGGSYVYFSNSLEDGSSTHGPMPVISFDRRF